MVRVRNTMMFSETIEEIILPVDDVVRGAKDMFVVTFDMLELLRDCEEWVKSCVMFVEIALTLYFCNDLDRTLLAKLEFTIVVLTSDGLTGKTE